MVWPEDVSYAEIWINPFLKFIKHINNCIPNFIDLIESPWDWKQNLSSFPSGCTRGDVQPDVPPMIQNAPTSFAASLRQSVRHHGSDRPFPIAGRRHVRRLVRCLALQPGTACQARSVTGIPKASAGLASWGIFKAWAESG